MNKALPYLIGAGILFLLLKKKSEVNGISDGIEIKARNIFQGAGSVYNSIGLRNGKKQFHFTKVTGKANYVQVRDANSVWGGLGKEFKTFEDAAIYYKSPLMKTMLLFAESELNNPSPSLNGYL